MADDNNTGPKIEGALVGFYGKIGGPEAATHERAGLRAAKKGHFLEGAIETGKLDAAIVKHWKGRLSGQKPDGGSQER